MFGLNLLRSAITRLAGSLNSLADTADQINANVRQQLALDAPSVEVSALSTPAEASGFAQDGTSPPETAARSPVTRNGRRKAAGTATE